MANINIEVILEKVDQIPTIPALSIKINEIVNDPNSDANALAEVISNDMAIASKILKIVNSAYYGFSEPIHSLQHAITILGFDLVKNLTLGIACVDTFKQHSKYGFDRNLLWIHSLAVATCSKIIANKTKNMNEKKIQNLFIAGLLHDLGKVIIECYFPDQFADILKEAKKKNVSYYEAEQVVMGQFTHEIIGKIVSEKWGFPDFLVEALSAHHNPVNVSDKNKIFVSTIHLADFAAEIAEIGSTGSDIPTPLQDEVFETLGLDEDQLKQITVELFEKKSEIESMMGSLDPDTST
ncbi:MAG: HDOD domain-containing protein [Spirochaetes bacterium]|nr:HDOD domain-containing protein [Spirochaetota bacterium]MCK5266793.1 HDOD domain-containing protein [Spirochaetota bacterium]